MEQIVEVENLEKVLGGLCITILLPRNSKLHVLKAKEDLKPILGRMLKNLEPGEYPFITIGLAPIAYGRVLKKPRASSASDAVPSSVLSRRGSSTAP